MAETILGNEAPEGGVIENNVVAGSPTPEQKPAQQQAAPFDFGKMIGAEGALAENWKEGLPESIRSEKCLDSIKTIGALAQSYVHAQHAIGAGKVAVPGENATPEEWAAFWKAGGRPDKAEDYKTDGVELPEGVTLDDNALKEFRDLAHAAGISQKGFEAALAFDIKLAQEQAQAAEQQAQREYEETNAALRNKYGEDKAKEVVAQCNATIRQFGLMEVLSEHNLLSNLTLIEALANIGSKMSETRIKGAEQTSAVSDPETRLAELRANLDGPLYKSDHPGHQAAVEEVRRLSAILAAAQKK